MTPLHTPHWAKGDWETPQERIAPRSEAAVARPVIGQVVQAITRNTSDGVVEVRLQPEELGRVRLSISPAEAGHTVQIAAERPETLDLVRRHIELLAADLRDRGFGNLDFSFGQERRAPGAPFDAHDDTPPPEDGPGRHGLSAQLSAAPRAVHDGRLDMRI